MNGEVLQKLGVGALMAYAALPVLLWTVRRSRDAEASSRQRALVGLLVLDVALLALPFGREAALGVLSRMSPAPAVSAEVAPLPEADGDAPAILPPAPAQPRWSRAAFEASRAAGLLWAALVAACLVTAAARIQRMARVRRRGQAPPDALLARIDAAARSAGLRPPYVVCSDEVELPFVTGTLRPALVLPARMLGALDDAALDLAIRHELTHLRRLDHWQAALVSTLGALLPIHPVWPRFRREYALAREEAVDALVAPLAPHAYAHLLVDAAAFTQFGAGELRVAMSGTDLAHRVERLTAAVPRGRARLAWAAAAFAVFGCGALAVPTPKVEEPASPGSSQTVRPAQAGEAATLRLPVGAQKVLTLPGLAKVAVGDPSIADVKTLGQEQLLVTATGAGTTTLLAWQKGQPRREYRVEVDRAGPEDAEPATVRLQAGEEKVLTVPGMSKLAVGDPAIADVKALRNDQLLLTGVSEGRTTVFVWKHGGERVAYVADVRPAPLPEVVSQSEVMQVVLERTDAIVRCVKAQKQAQPNLSGTVVVRWTIDLDGTTRQVGIASSDAPGQPIEACLTQLAGTFAFPRHTRAQEVVAFPFKF